MKSNFISEHTHNTQISKSPVQKPIDHHNAEVYENGLAKVNYRSPKKSHYYGDYYQKSAISGNVTLKILTKK